MKDKFLHIIRQKPVFLYLLPIFFVLHGFTENYDFIPVKDALVLTAVYMGFSVLFALLFWLLYRNSGSDRNTRANLAALAIMAFNFFFGSVHDSLKKLFPESFIVKYIFVLPTALVLFIVLFVVLKKTKKPLHRLSYFLNIVILLFILVDVVTLSVKAANREKQSSALPPGFIACDTCAKPDIYFILADEYAGNEELKEIFQFDNSGFHKKLDSLGFRAIPYSQSNYNYTPFSVASTLNMSYLDLKGKERTQPDLTYSYESIRDNRLLKFLEFHGYSFYNYSVFDFEGQPARVRETFLPVKTRLITAQTFLHRFDKEIRFNLVTRWKSEKNLEILTYANKHNNDNIYDLTWKQAEQDASKPKFIYAHLMMPHYPYYFDRHGNEQPFEKLQEGNQVDKKAYIEYLQYSNNKLEALVTHIISSSKSPPIIVLMGDHGFRHFKEPVEFKYYFQNLAAVYLPWKNYSAFPDSMTSVNLFRGVLNTSFGQRLPFLKDSSTYLMD